VSASQGAGDRPGTPPVERRRRPVLVELASALLIVGGVINLLISSQVLVLLGLQGGGVGGPALATIVLNTVILVLGVLVRFGRAWLVAVNVLAVLAFLELLSGTPVGLVYGAIDVLVVLALVRERPWFTWSAETRRDASNAGDQPFTPPTASPPTR
jgi:hypothetical protein